MKGNDLELRPVQGVVVADDSGRAGDGSPMVVSALNKIRNQVWQRELAAIASRVRTWNEVVRALTDSERLKVEYATALVRAENLDQLRIAEEAKVLAEVRKIFDDEEDRQKDRELRNLTREAQLIRAKRDLEALSNPPAPKVQSGEGRGSRGARRIREIREERDEMVKAFCGEVSEGSLSEEERQIVADIRLACEHQIKRFLEEGSD